MYKRILLAYDGTQAGQKALLDCSEIAQWSKADLFLVAVMPIPLTTIGPEGGVYGLETHDADRQEYLDILDVGLERLRSAGLSAKGELLSGDSVDSIVRCATDNRVDLIIVGHKHLDSWAERWWRGSVSKALIELSPCSVLVAII